jgi:hypothetical protein
MNAYSRSEQPSRIVLVVGVDMSNVSEHLLTQTRALIGPVDEAEVHGSFARGTPRTPAPFTTSSARRRSSSDSPPRSPTIPGRVCSCTLPSGLPRTN